MRIKGEYIRYGYFWLPNKKNNRVPGILTVKDGAVIELELIGHIDNENISIDEADDDIPRIIGEVEKDGYVTLENCFYVSKPFPMKQICKTRILVNLAYIGVAYCENEIPTFNSVIFSVDNLDEWVGLTGINVTYGEDRRSAKIEYFPQEPRLFEIGDGLTMHILFGYTLPQKSVAEAKVTQKTFIKISSKRPRRVEEYSIIISELTHFLCFAIDEIVSVIDLSGRSDNVTANGYSPQIGIFYGSNPHPAESVYVRSGRMLFTFEDIQENAQTIINNWFGSYNDIRPSLGLYFSAVAGSHRYLDGRFLALAQCLETFHRRTSSETLMEFYKYRTLLMFLVGVCPPEFRPWLIGRLAHGNEISLSSRIKRIIEPYKSHLGNSKERSRLIRGIVNTRNYLTHYSESLENDALKGKKLWDVCEKMEAIFQLHLLQQLGFIESEINNKLSSNDRLKRKIAQNQSN